MTDFKTPMNLFSPSGTKVLFLKLDGVPGQEFAAEHLTEGTIYTVDSIDVHRFISYVTLKEVPDFSFNTVLFFEESKEVHLDHCYQGEYEDCCKYGLFKCPAKPVEPIEVKTCWIGFNSYTCPTCGWKCRSQYEGLRVSLPNTQGVYCMECYGKWIHANIPKLIEDKHE